MDPRHGYGYTFATCLCALHFFTSAVCVRISQWMGFEQHATLPMTGAREVSGAAQNHVM